MADHTGVAKPDGLEYHLTVITPGAVGEVTSLISVIESSLHTI